MAGSSGREAVVRQRRRRTVLAGPEPDSGSGKRINRADKAPPDPFLFLSSFPLLHSHSLVIFAEMIVGTTFRDHDLHAALCSSSVKSIPRCTFHLYTLLLLVATAFTSCDDQRMSSENTSLTDISLTETRRRPSRAEESRCFSCCYREPAAHVPDGERRKVKVKVIIS